MLTGDDHAYEETLRGLAAVGLIADDIFIARSALEACGADGGE